MSGFFGLSKEGEEILRSSSCVLSVKKGDLVFSVDEASNAVYFIEEGHISLVLCGRKSIQFRDGSTFGEFGFFEHEPRRADAMVESETACVRKITRESLHSLSPQDLMSMLHYVGKRVTSLLKGEDIYRHLEVLIVQDGGCAPGYDSVTSFLVQHFEALGLGVYAAKEGFRSLVSGQHSDFVSLIWDREAFLLYNLVPRIVFAPNLRDRRGASFRSERFPEFKDSEVQDKAVTCLKEREVKVVVAIGGNGTFMGIRALAKKMENEKIQFFFIPATIDSDIHGTECIGEHTGVEMGAEKLRCYMGDAHTHKRCYLVEMMGAEGGFHALHSAIGAGAALSVMPNSVLDLEKLSEKINKREDTVVAVAEGYGKHLPHDIEKRKAAGSASKYLHNQLKEKNMISPTKRVIDEPFSRDIRGATPNNKDIFLSQTMAKQTVDMFVNGETNKMATVNAATVGSLNFTEIETDNRVSVNEVTLSDSLSVHANVE